MGYAGGSRANPTYTSLGNHTECFEVTFDPARITYRDLLRIFWKSHHPFTASGNRQYMAAVFPAGEEQKKIAEASREEVARDRSRAVATPVVPLDRFWPAEDYHQKHSLRRHADLLAEFAAYYPTGPELTRSTAAARVNGFLGGHGTREQFDRIKDSLGLSEKSLAKLARLFPPR